MLLLYVSFILMSSALRAEFELGGGQMVMLGNISSEIGWVVMEVEIGEASQSL